MNEWDSDSEFKKRFYAKRFNGNLIRNEKSWPGLKKISEGKDPGGVPRTQETLRKPMFSAHFGHSIRIQSNS